MADSIQRDIDAINSIRAVRTILDVVCRATGMGFAAVARVTEDRWVACALHDEIAFGLVAGGELDVETTLCRDIRGHRKPIVIDHVAADPAYARHGTPAMYGFQSYISIPIILADGSFFGTLCAIDPQPHRLNTPETIGMFTLFAELLAFHLDAVDRLASTESRLGEAHATAELREQFIAVLGHDLRNPLASIDAATRLLARTPLNERAAGIILMMQASVRRMSGLIDNVLDLARGRLGGGVPVVPTADTSLQPLLEHVLLELRTSAPDRVIEADFRIPAAMSCDAGRIAQLLSNLVANALTHGAPDRPVHVSATTSGGRFELAVANEGEPIPPEMLPRLFQPFTRGAAQPGQHGLGLGLYIAAEIAHAHGGTLDVTSNAAITRFVFRMGLHESKEEVLF